MSARSRAIRSQQSRAPPSERFLASAQGRVLNVGAGSGRASIGLLLAKRT
jgi:hypothetical protein